MERTKISIEAGAGISKDFMNGQEWENKVYYFVVTLRYDRVVDTRRL